MPLLAIFLGLFALSGSPVPLSLESPPSETTPPKLVNALVAKVGDEYVTVFDVHLDALLERLRISPAPFELDEVRTLSEQQFQTVLSNLVVERLVLADVQILQLVSEEAINHKHGASLATFERERLTLAHVQPLLTALGLTPSELLARLRAKLMVQEYLDLTLGPELTSREAELRHHYQKNRGMYGNRSFEEVRPSVQAALVAEKRKTRLQTWLARLRERTPVTLLSLDVHLSTKP
ncbi:MAG: hypothetical protein A2284_13160 [Deltaproteobacteria bacterium RIFOXYA12_FULL_61_11]|nr:MAG: hypothetical protein A2284_13160 [Deltaproteobacteria bacterium RIFOXYA12_FULL_61_11]